MAWCEDCIHCDKEWTTTEILGRTKIIYRCRLMKREVHRDGSCNSFKQEPVYNESTLNYRRSR